jgi:hypothetical protein
MLSSILLQIRITIFGFVFEFYIYNLRRYIVNLRFTFYESLLTQC